MNLVMLSIFALGLAAEAGPVPVYGDAADVLAKIRALAGDWRGTYQWTGAITDSGSMGATYTVTGKGSAITENLIQDGAPIMTTMYHLDGTDLRMTHYCGAQNQPRLKAERIDDAEGTVDFTFVDVTNLKSPAAAHVHGFQLRFVDADHLVLKFLFNVGEKRAVELITLARVSKSSVPLLHQ